MLAYVRQKIDAIENVTARASLRKCVPVAERLMADWRCRVMPNELLVVAATPKGGLVVVADDWPKASENAFLLAQREHDNCAAALIAAIESMEGDLVLGGLWFLGSGKGKFEAERARIAKSGKMPLVIALAAYEGGSLMTLVAMVEMPPTYVTGATAPMGSI